jgi:hypothetical protein
MATKDISDKQVCLAYAEYKRMYDAHEYPVHWPYEILESWTGQPKKVCLSAMERAARKDLVEWGVSLRAGWLTKVGREIIEVLHAE